MRGISGVQSQITAEIAVKEEFLFAASAAHWPSIFYAGKYAPGPLAFEPVLLLISSVLYGRDFA